MARVVWVIWYREVLRFARDPVRIVSSLLGPVTLLFVFAKALEPSVGALGRGVDFQTFMFPGALSMSVIFTAMFAATSIVWDQEFGFVKEILVAPTPRSAIVLGKVAGGTTVAVVQGLFILVLAPLVGISLSLPMALKVVAITALLALALSALGTLLASAVRRIEAFQAVTQVVMMPMFFLSGAMFPFRGLPGWLSVAVALNPVAYGVDPVRRAVFEEAGLPEEVIAQAGTGIEVFGTRLSVAAELVILAAIAALLLGLSVRSFSRKEVAGGRGPSRPPSRAVSAPTSGAAIEARALARSYGSVEAVRGVTFDVRPGEIFGFLGPNGAGKTTTISMFCTLLTPTTGDAWVAGHHVARERDEVRRSIGLVFQEPALDEYLTARENLLFHAVSYGMGRSSARARIDDILERVDLAAGADRKVITFSGGMKRRLELGRGLLHSPRVLFLDEPTIGLDPQSRRQIWEYVRRLQAEERLTIFLTTHYMDEAAICDRIAIIDHGEIVALDTPEHLKQSLGGAVVELRTPEADAALSQLGALGLQGVRHDGVVRFEHPEGEQAALAALRRIDVELAGLEIHRPTLDDVFVSLTGRAIRDSEADRAEVLRAQQRTGMVQGARRR